MEPERAVARQDWALIRTLLPGEPTEVETVLERLKHYARLLLEWNRGVSNLISRHDEGRLVERHIAESLFPAAILRDSGCTRFVDLGSGAGLPGIPLALAGVGSHWTMVESRRNKTLFMRRAVQDCKIDNIDVVTSRLETLLDEAPDTLACDAFTSRATMTIGPTLEMAARIVRPGGKAFLWKGSSFTQEMSANRDSWSGDWDFDSSPTVLAGPNVIAIFVRK